jgi:hypothetical protein
MSPKIAVQGHQDTYPGSHRVGYGRIVCPRKVLLRHRIRLEPRLTKPHRGLNGQVFINLEFQALISRGSGAVPSRASSAA